jgi:hypothetical protein
MPAKPPDDLPDDFGHLPGIGPDPRDVRIAELEAALRPFAREHTHAEIAPRAAFAHAAELLKE